MAKKKNDVQKQHEQDVIKEVELDKDDASTAPEENTNELYQAVEKAEKEKEEAVALLQRLQADFDNYRKRNAAIRADSLDEGERAVIKALLPVLDNFDRALMGAANVDENWINGIKLVHRQFTDELKKCGLEEIEAESMFDPNCHEAVMQEELDDVESGMITAVFQKGYKVKNRIIRPTMVKVAK